MNTTRYFLACTLLMGLTACELAPTKTSTSVTPAQAAPLVDTIPAHDNLNAVVWMQNSVEYKLLAGQTWRSGLVQLDRAIKTPGWDALTPDEREKPVSGLPMAVIVDIDETVLDNSPFQARLIRDQKKYGDPSWEAWVNEQAATAIPGALEFAKAAKARGVKIFYITNRTVQLQEATVANLRKLGFPVESDTQVMGRGMAVVGCEGTSNHKNCRRIAVGREYRVLMQFGDQLGDMVTLFDNSPLARENAVKPYLNWVGERWFILPNPSYGSWQSALYDKDRAQSEEEYRKQKHEALKY